MRSTVRFLRLSFVSRPPIAPDHSVRESFRAKKANHETNVQSYFPGKGRLAPMRTSCRRHNINRGERAEHLFEKKCARSLACWPAANDVWGGGEREWGLFSQPPGRRRRERERGKEEGKRS